MFPSLLNIQRHTKPQQCNAPISAGKNFKVHSIQQVFFEINE